jgi:hypothetical protein
MNISCNDIYLFILCERIPCLSHGSVTTVLPGCPPTLGSAKGRLKTYLNLNLRVPTSLTLLERCSGRSSAASGNRGGLAKQHSPRCTAVVGTRLTDARHTNDQLVGAIVDRTFV